MPSPLDIDRAIPFALGSDHPSVSFEFFPPKDDVAEAHLWQAVRRLEKVVPTFVSVTYGAGGSTRDRTVRVTERIAKETTMVPMAHLTCVGSSVAELRQVIGQYAGAGVRNVLALRGDPPGGPGTPWTAHPEGLDHAEDLVALLRELGEFTVGVAAFPDKHPESPSLEADAQVLARKAEVGAQFAVSQFVFDPLSWVRLRDAVVALGCQMPIIPGVMPVTNLAQITRMAQLSGTPLPPDVVKQLEAVGDDARAVREVGVEIATRTCERLLAEGAPGLHFYTMNRSTATLRVYRNLGLEPAHLPVMDSPRAGARTRVELADAAGIGERSVLVREMSAADDVTGWMGGAASSAGSCVVAVHGDLIDVSTLPALVAIESGRVVGVVTYSVTGERAEIVSCDAQPAGRGIGRLLVEGLLERLRAEGVTAVHCTTTNDNLGALGFWQVMGLRLTALRPDAVERARELKPSIPRVGDSGIPIRDELDLELTF